MKLFESLVEDDPFVDHILQFTQGFLIGQNYG